MATTRGGRRAGFNVGDRVRALNDIGPVKRGELGVVMVTGGMVGVMWDKKNTILHNLDGACPNEHGYWVPNTDLGNEGSIFGPSGMTITGTNGLDADVIKALTQLATARPVMNTAVNTALTSTFSGLMSPGSILQNPYFFDEAVPDEPKKKVKPKVFELSHLDALIIDAKTKEEIIAVLKQSKHHDKLFKEWGLGDVIEYGKGMTYLFYGPPGTGKTWAANCIAKVLGTTLLSIGQAEIQSQEPGAANRNIQEAFATATAKKQVLLIDECDSLITSRQGLGMILAGEVNTLLTEIEKFEGVCILATNRVEQMDAALERRISLIAEFKEPGPVERELIWGRLLPPKLPLGEKVDPKSLAKHELTGGQIKNVVLSAARLALAEESEKVEAGHFDRAVTRVLASKGLMGHSNYDQTIHVHQHTDITRGLDSFLDTELEKDIEEETV